MELGVRSHIGFVGVMLALAALFVLGAQSFVVGLIPAPYDKLAHALLFGALFLALDRVLILPVWLCVMVSLAASAADELHQLWLPGREPGLGDWVAGAMGVFLAAGWRRYCG